MILIDKLIEDRKLSTAGLLDAISKVCSTEQFDNVLSILIETPFPCINKENSEDKECLVKMNMFVPEEVSSETRMQIIKILRVCSKDNHTLLFKARILDKHVGLISIYKQGDGLIFISTRSRL